MRYLGCSLPVHRLATATLRRGFVPYLPCAPSGTACRAGRGGRARDAGEMEQGDAMPTLAIRRTGRSRSDAPGVRAEGDDSVIDDVPAADWPSTAGEVVFAAHEVAVRYSGVVAVQGVTLDVHARRITALIGPSGCGKSTFLRTFNRMNDLVPGAEVVGPPRVPRPRPLRPRRRPDRGPAPHRHGLPEAEPVPEVDLRQRRVRAPHHRRARASTRWSRARCSGARCGTRSRTSSRSRRSRSPAASSSASASRGPRGRARRDPDGRAVLGARPDRDLGASKTS